jgi:hypothetical protein
MQDKELKKEEVDMTKFSIHTAFGLFRITLYLFLGGALAVYILKTFLGENPPAYVKLLVVFGGLAFGWALIILDYFAFMKKLKFKK